MKCEKYRIELLCNNNRILQTKNKRKRIKKESRKTQRRIQRKEGRNQKSMRRQRV